MIDHFITNKQLIFKIFMFIGCDLFSSTLDFQRLSEKHLKQLKSKFKYIKFYNLNPNQIHNFIQQIKEIYKSFGYNLIKIEFQSEVDLESNTANLYLDIHEGKITKIKNIYFVGNDNFDSNILRSEIKSKIKSL